MKSQNRNTSLPQLDISPVEAASALHELHKRTASTPADLLGAGAIAATGVIRESGLLVPASVDGTEVSMTSKSEESQTTSAETFEQRVESVKNALFERYRMYEGVRESDFNLLAYWTEAGEKKHTVMYTGTHGINLGRPYERTREGILTNPSHVVIADGVRADTRTLTKDAYQEFVTSAVREGLDPLPDDNSKNHGKPIGTLLFDEPTRVSAAGRRAIVWQGWVSHGRAVISEDSESDELFFRPAVEVVS